MELPNNIDIETISTCNRVCPTCLRNSHPNKDAVASWFKPNYLQTEIIRDILIQAKEWNFSGAIHLSHFNEPLMDDRLPALAAMVKMFGFTLNLNSNGDFLTEELAEKFDGVFDKIIFSLYMPEPKKSERRDWILKLFNKTEIIISMGEHIPSHFSPKFNVAALAEQYRENNCREPEQHLIINHRRQYLLCCEDLIGNFNLGTFPETSLKDYWFGKRAKIQEALLQRGSRTGYCASCPKP